MTTNIEAAKRLQYHIDNDLLTRLVWKSRSTRGDSVCLLAAVAPECAREQIPTACPADIMPAWLASLTPLVNDRGSGNAWADMVRRYAGVLARWYVLNDDAWRRVKLATLRECLTIVQNISPSKTGDRVMSLLVAHAHEDDLRWGEIYNRFSTGDCYPAQSARKVAEAAACEKPSLVSQAAKMSVNSAATTHWSPLTGSRTTQTVPVPDSWDRITDALLTAIENECTKKEQV